MSSSGERVVKRRTTKTVASSSVPLDEQIQKKRLLLSTELPRQLPKLHQYLSGLEQRLRGLFRNDQINEYRALADQKLRLEQRIAEIEQGKLIREFDDFVHQLQQTPKLALMPPVVNDQILKTEKVAQTSMLDIWSGSTPRNKTAVDRPPKTGGKKVAFASFFANNNKVTPLTLTLTDVVMTDADTSQSALILCGANNQGTQLVKPKPSSLMIETDADNDSDQDDNDDELFRESGAEQFDALTWLHESSLAFPSLVAQSHMSNTIYDRETLNLKQAQWQRQRQQMTPKTNEPNQQQLRDLNEFTGVLMDYSIIAPRAAEKDMCFRCQVPLVRSEDDSLSCEECGYCKSFLDTTSQSSNNGYGGKSGGGGFHTGASARGSSSSTNSHQGRCIRFESIFAYFSVDAYVDIPDQVYATLRDEAFIIAPQMSELPLQKIRDILKKYHWLNVYNEVQIYAHLNNMQRPLLTEQQKTTLRMMFNKLREPFEKFRGGRRNFLTYPLVFVKLCEVAGYKEFVPYFNLLKCGRKLVEQERTLKSIFDLLGWKFTSSLQ